VILSKVTGTIIFCGFSVFLLFMGIFAGMCQWYNPKVHFIKKNDNATKIVERSYGCGASDSGPPIQKYFKVKELTSFLNWTTEVDLKEIDRKEWNEAVIQ